MDLIHPAPHSLVSSTGSLPTAAVVQHSIIVYRVVEFARVIVRALVGSLGSLGL